MARLAWKDYHRDMLLLAEMLEGWRPDIIAPSMLGGLIPAAIIAKRLGIKDVRPIDIERKGEERRLAYDVQGEMGGKRVLLLEDDLPTGEGFRVVKGIFQERGANVKIAAIYVTPTSRGIADYFVEVRDRPPDYPWKPFHDGDRVRG